MGMIQAPNQTPADRLDRMVQQYEKELLRICYVYLRDRTAAEDIVQETFLKAFRHMDSFRGASSEKTWLIRIAINCCRDYRRSAWYRYMDFRVSVDQLPFPMAALAAGFGLFGELAQNQHADQRLGQLEEAAETMALSLVTEDGIAIEIGQAYYEGKRVFLSYRLSGDLCSVELYEGAQTLVFELLYPSVGQLEGLTLVPVYDRSGEHPDEAIHMEQLVP